MKVLLLDDSRLETEVIKYKLKQQGVDTVICFDRAKLAYDYLINNYVDLIIIDLDMPGDDGLSVLSELHAMNFKEALCILSGLNYDIVLLAERLAHLLSLNLIYSSVKPLTDDQLVKLLANASSFKCPDKSVCQKKSPYTFDEIKLGIEYEQMFIEYQPQFDFKTQRMVGVEALARWRHPKDGIIYPNEFVAVLESEGCTYLLFDWVLDRVMQDMIRLPDNVKVSVNASANDFCDVYLVEKLVAKFDFYKVSAAKLQIELTEACVYNLSATMLKNIVRLKILGVDLSIDDFGTGYSNLINLVELPFTELKIDRQFVKNYLDNLKHKHALEVSVQLANKLGLRTVVEGIESKEEYDAMMKLGVDICQGYLIGKPQPLEQLLLSTVTIGERYWNL